MRVRLNYSLLIILSLFAGRDAFSAADPVRQIRFNRDIRPILAETCFHCHGADPGSRKGKFRLDREEGFFTARDDGPPVVRGKPEASNLYKRITATDPEEVMPPPKEQHTLKPDEIQRIKLWIAQGAQWEPHWSFLKPERPAIASVRDDAWARNPIDRFVLAKIEEAGLQPAPEADRRTLVRRLALDLTGLPPEPDLVEAFVTDKAPDAYEKLVDRFMASPRYGEHRARYWLDAARYADTHGIHFDNFRDIWPYRDWVINAFNRNQPFDQFTVEQLAGDLLPNATQEQIIATGFHRCNPTTNEGGTIELENLANYARDRVETTSWVWLGLTANCAVCHDHKFDPISTKDFYSMSAFFRNTTQGGLDGNVRDTAPTLLLPLGDDVPRSKAIPSEIAEAKKKIDESRKALHSEFDKWLEQAKPGDGDAMVEKIGAPAFYLPLNEEKPGDPAGLAGTSAVVAKATEPLKWQDGGKFGKAPGIGGKAFMEVAGDVGNFEKDQKYSYGCWVKLPKEFKGSGAVMARMDNTDNYRGWDLYAQDSEIAAHLINKWPDDAVKVATTGGLLKRDTWQHVFVTYDGSTKASGFRIYVDGKEAKLNFEKDQLKSTTRGTAPLTIGRRKSSDQLSGGWVQDVRIYNRRLEAAEVKGLAMQPRMKILLGKAAKERSAKEKDELFEPYSAGNPELAEISNKLSTLETEQKSIRERSATAYIMEEKRGSTPTANILYRGQYDQPKDKVECGVFSFLNPLPPNAPKNRLGLAQWIVSPENPLMARVTVNRCWQEFFGTGIVKTAEDFGIMGEAPSHPELLDYLATDFRDGGWDMKKLIKLIVTSATYRQAAATTKEKTEKDPGNRLLSHGTHYRMDAEMIRDYALDVSGLLSPKIGGPSVKPYQPEGVWEAVAMQESNTHNYKQDTGEALYRRSMYTFWKRAAPPASMEIMNAPKRETSCLRRERTDTPLQALVTLNDPQFVEAARVLAQNAMKSGAADDAGRMDYIARRVLSRPLSEKENAIIQKIHGDLTTHYKAHADDVKALLTVGAVKTDASLEPVALAAWTMVCNQMLNLDEMLNK